MKILLTAGMLLLGCALLPRWNARLLASDNNSPTDGERFYLEKIRPILSQKCYKCHTDDPLSHLRVDSRAALLQGGKRGPAGKLTEQLRQQMGEGIRVRPDLTLVELQLRLWEQYRLEVSLSRLWTVLGEMELTLKKSHSTPASEIQKKPVAGEKNSSSVSVRSRRKS